MTQEPVIITSEGRRVGRTVRLSEPMELSIAGRLLDHIRIDHQTRFQFGDVEVVIEGEFTMCRDGDEQRFDPVHREGLGPVVALYPDTVHQALVTADTTLELHLESGAVISVPPDLSFEAWQVNGPNTSLIVCPPSGGELAVWD